MRRTLDRFPSTRCGHCRRDKLTGLVSGLHFAPAWRAKGIAKSTRRHAGLSFERSREVTLIGIAKGQGQFSQRPIRSSQFLASPFRAQVADIIAEAATVA